MRQYKKIADSLGVSILIALAVVMFVVVIHVSFYLGVYALLAWLLDVTFVLKHGIAFAIILMIIVNIFSPNKE